MGRESWVRDLWSLDIQLAPGEKTLVILSLPFERSTEKKVLSPEMSGEEAPASSIQPSKPVAQKIRVLLVDDHVMLRQSLRTMLETYSDIELVGEAANGEEAVRRVEQRRPEVVVMDINMPGINGIEATKQIKLRYPDTMIIGISVNAARENQEAMVRAGAVQLLTKEAAIEDLHDAILLAVKTREMTR
jgi:CheY-like chemotaxis protein